MKQKTKLFSNIRLVYLRSSPLTKCVVLATLIVTTVALLALTASIRDARLEAAANREKAETLISENQKLQDKLDSMGTLEGNKALAAELFGLVDPDTVVITPAP